MKRSIMFLIIAFMIVGLMVVAGCGKKTVTVETDEGAVTMEEENGDVTFTDEEGETTLSSSVPTEEEIGVPFYPGAEIVEDECLNASGTLEDGDESTELEVTLLTKDPAPKVYEWYKDQLSGKPDFECECADGSDEDYGWLDFGIDVDDFEDFTEVYIGTYSGKTGILIVRDIHKYNRL